MIRVRAQSGKIINIEEPLKYVEILDASDNVAMVFYTEVMHGGKLVSVVTPDVVDEASTYSKMYGVEWTNSVQGELGKSEDMVLTKK